MGHVVIPSNKPFSHQSNSVYGSAAAPAATTTLVTTGALDAGRYWIRIIVYFNAGAPAAADADNFQLLNGASIITRLIAPPAVNAPFARPMPSFVLDVASLASVSVQNIGAGTAGVTYVATVTVMRENE